MSNAAWLHVTSGASGDNPRVRVENLYKKGNVTQTAVAFQTAMLYSRPGQSGYSYVIWTMTDASVAPGTPPGNFVDRKIVSYAGQATLEEFPTTGKSRFVEAPFDINFQMTFDRQIQ